MGKQRRNSADHRFLYKRTSISNAEGLVKKRVALNEALRKKHREQLITAKRRSLPQDYCALTTTQVDSLAVDLLCNDKDVRLEAIRYFCQFILDPAPALIEYIVRGDCIETLSHSLSNIAAGSYELWKRSFAFIPFLISQLDSDNQSLREVSARALGNIAAENLGDMNDEDDKARATIRDNGAVQPLVRMLDSKNPNLIQNACFALANLARGQENELAVFFQTNIVDALKKHLVDDPTETASEVCWVMSYLTAGSAKFREEMVEKGFVPSLVNELKRLVDQGAFILPVLRTIGHLISLENDKCLKLVVDQEHFLGVMVKVINSDQAQDVNIIEGVENLNILDYLTHLVASDDAFDIRKNASNTLLLKDTAAYCIVNVANHGGEHLDQLNHKKLLLAFLDLIKSQDLDVVRLGLGYIELLLTQSPKGKEAIDAVPDCMEALAAITPSDPELYGFANSLIEQYYGEGSSDMKS
ncbi:ARM repeat-containing protein [Backusella circina FSU 941]|nr:ARM repeat-containing protein [Backusella circina FSU 941]